MATEIQYLDISNYKWTPSIHNGNEFIQYLKWSKGKLEPIYRQDLEKDMWKQYLRWNGAVKEHNRELASEWAEWQQNKDAGWAGWENPWPEGTFIKIEHPTEVPVRLLLTDPTPDWEELVQQPEEPIFCESLVDTGNCNCGKCY